MTPTFWTWADQHAWCAAWVAFWVIIAVWSTTMKVLSMIDSWLLTRRSYRLLTTGRPAAGGEKPAAR